MVGEAERDVAQLALPRRNSRTAGARILLVEDDRQLSRLLQRYLRRRNYALDTIVSAPDARLAFEWLLPDLVLLDLDLGDSSGWGLIEHFRSRSGIPIVAVSTLRGERYAVSALELGADDYLVKPFGLEELVARIRVALRHVARPRSGADPVLQLGNLTLDLDRHCVFRAGRPIQVTPTEYRLLKVFACQPDRFLSDGFLMDAVWGAGRQPAEHLLHVYIARLRKKVEDDPAAPRRLLNQSSLGYRFATSEAVVEAAASRTGGN